MLGKSASRGRPGLAAQTMEVTQPAALVLLQLTLYDISLTLVALCSYQCFYSYVLLDSLKQQSHLPT